MKKLYAYSYFDGQSPVDDGYAEIAPTVEAIKEYRSKCMMKSDEVVNLVISFETGFKVYEHILDELDIEPALDALNKL